jgi:hypothetical protein
LGEYGGSRSRKKNELGDGGVVNALLFLFWLDSELDRLFVVRNSIFVYAAHERGNCSAGLFCCFSSLFVFTHGDFTALFM